jgi:hypothetical protein
MLVVKNVEPQQVGALIRGFLDMEAAYRCDRCRHVKALHFEGNFCFATIDGKNCGCDSFTVTQR